MDKDTYGVELQLITNKFKSNFSEIKSMMKEFSIEAKRNFTTGVNIDIDKTEDELKTLERKIKDSVEISKKQIEELNNAKLNLSNLYNKRDSGLYKGVARGELESDIVSEQNRINDLTKELQINRQTVKNYASAYKDLNMDLERTETKMGILGTVVGNLKRTFQDIGSYVKRGFGKETTEQIENVNNELNNTGSAGKNAGNGISSMMSKGVKSLKRFALSLFSLQSIWRILSRASSAYIQQNTELASKMQSLWNGLGTLVGPVVDYLADIFIKFLSYINVVTKALFDFDFIAKANENTLKNYQKQISKTSKALSGIDELTNINQQTQDNGVQGLIEMPELDKGIVKFLEDLSQALKDNWEWLQWVAYGLGITFGAVKVAEWINNIKKLLGIAGVNGAGGSGLLGLASTLGWIAGLTTLAVEIYIAYKYTKEWIDTSNDYNDAKKQSDKYKGATLDIIKAKKNEAKAYSRGSVELNSYINAIKEEIKHNAVNIKNNQDWYDSLNPIQKVMSSIDGQFQTHVESSEKSARAIEDLIDIYGELYYRGQLNYEQMQEYNEILRLSTTETGRGIVIIKDAQARYENLAGSVSTASDKQGVFGFVVKNTADYLSYENDEVRKNADEISKSTTNWGLFGTGVLDAVNGIDKFINKNTDLSGSADNTNNKLNNVKQNVQNLKEQIERLTGGKYTLVIDTKFSKPDTSAIEEALKKLNKATVTGSVASTIAKMIIPSYAVGTDLVKSDGLAYIHAGERIVPADAVKGGYTGGNNQETNNLLRQLIDTLENKEFSASIGADDVGRASVNYIRNQNRIMGGSVI